MERVATIGQLAENHLQDLIASGASVDDNTMPLEEIINTMPLEENIPSTMEPENKEVFSPSLGHKGICLHCQEGGQNMKASVLHFPGILFLPLFNYSNTVFEGDPSLKHFLQEMVLKETNAAMHSTESPITYGELLQFNALRFQMVTTTFENQQDCWSIKTVS